jgi:hypothetical protein
MGEIEALHLACAFDMKIPHARRAEVQRLIAAVNEQLWVGHFDIWTHTGMIMYRQALVLPGGLTASTAQCEAMLVGAIHACERYYPAFQFVVWAGKSAQEAMNAAMFEPGGSVVVRRFHTPSSLRTQGPIRRDAMCSRRLLRYPDSLKPPVVMGPCVRRDDTDLVTP